MRDYFPHAYSGTQEQFSVEFYPDSTPNDGFLVQSNRPSVAACTAAGAKPVLTVAFQGSSV